MGRARSGRAVVLLIAALTAALYLRTLARGVLPGDAGEFQMAAWNFGVAHATGYPLYLILGGIWQRLWSLFGVSPALALNAWSAVFGVACVVLFYSITARWLQGPPAIRTAAAVLAAAWLATNPTFWSQALIAEVYTLHALFLVLILGALQRLESAEERSANPVWLFLLLGLSLAHHATTALYAPGIAVFLWFTRARLTRRGATWLLAAVALLAPLLLYLYVPLRATPAASPWYFPRLGTETLPLYAGGVQGFLDFVTGRSISVGFRGAGEAIAALPEALRLWRLHFGWVGLVLMVVGVYALVRRRQWPLLAFTAITLVCLQIFNLFYAIGDILVYYIPLYVIGSLWVGFGAWLLGTGFAAQVDDPTGGMEPTHGAEPAHGTEPARREERPVGIQWQSLGVVVIVGLLFLPLRQVLAYLPNLDQSRGGLQGRMWDGILASELARGAVLVSNDRNEIVPLYYKQYVEGVRTDITGIFPLIAPEARFADVGATVQTALDSGAPVYLAKPMPGLEVRFALAARPPVVQVLGPAANRSPETVVEQPFGPLTLLGFDRNAAGSENGENLVRLYWRVDAPMPGPFTTTVQLFDADGNKIAQNDAVAGGQFYPTSLWKPGEEIVETHTLSPTNGAEAATLLVGMYSGAELTPLAPSIMISLDGASGDN